MEGFVVMFKLLVNKFKKTFLQTEKKQIQVINNSGLFNAEFYHEHNQDVSLDESLIHYFYNGCVEGRQPSFLFDSKYYMASNPDLHGMFLTPLGHFIQLGALELRNPSPFVSMEHLVDNLRHKNITKSENKLAYFYKHEKNEGLSAHPYFDVEFYLLTNKDLHDSVTSPYQHFLTAGVYEGRDPRADINIKEYIEKYNVDVNEIHPFVHFIEQKGEEYLAKKLSTTMPHSTTNGYSKAVPDFRHKGPNYEEPAYLDKPHSSEKVKALAYYLPQFHPFAENDEWWGQGFTEWTNTTRGQPRFDGHYQPHLPKHLGYYDLRVKETMMEQVRYAKAAGLHGFCFYHYWFNGKRIMEKPVNMLLENKDIDIPFCIMWANENWTRTWDGLENDVLIAQDYFEEDDIPFIQDIGRHFKDERYIRIEGRPLFFIYRPGIIPNAIETIQKWRDLCKSILNEEPLFYMAQAFDDIDPREFGMDGAIEFPPHKIAAGLEDRSRSLELFDTEFSGHYPSYDELVASSLKEKEHDFPLIRGVTPTWDNEARKPGRGMGFIGSTPEKYEKWLYSINQYAIQNPIANNESFVIINAWNEWAEGSHLEPDVYWGAAYLNATYRAMNDIHQIDSKLKLFLVGHDAHKHGAQLLTLNIFKALRENFGIDVTCILLDGGPLVDEYKEVGPTHVAYGSLDAFEQITTRLNNKGEYHHAICNTTVTGLCTEKLTDQNIKVISLIHELPTLIKEYELEEHAETIAKNADKVIFAANFVKESFEGLVGDLGNKAIVKPQGIYQKLTSNKNASKVLRQKLSLSRNAKIVVNSGYADLRKGFDLFVQTAKECVIRDTDYHFLWLGNVEPSLQNWILKDIEGTKFEKHLHIIPFTNEISLYLEGANVFAMTSREDPFPSVVLESLSLGTPVVGFENGGGFADALEKECFGELVEMSNCVALAQAIENQIDNDSEESAIERSEFASEKYDWSDYVFSLVEYLVPDLKRISVVVPNYNYEQHIGDRLTSIFNQQYPIYELIVLDDNSSDNSVEIIKTVTETHKRKINLITNEQNSGSVFKQWEKGASLAKGDYLWIAEADDLAEPEFLAAIMQGDSQFTMAYSDSQQIDEENKHLADNYRYYYDDGLIAKLDHPGIYDGQTIIEDCLSIKNQFMNVSSVLFDKKSIQDFFVDNMDEILEFKVAGDWFVYVQLLKENSARCKIIGESLNIHRRHSGSVTKQNYDVQLKEISRMHDISSLLVSIDRKQQVEYLNEVKKVLEE